MNFANTQLEPLAASREAHLSSTYFDIDLRDNPLGCLCNASSFILWIQSIRTIRFTGLQDYRCLYPNGTWVRLVTVDIRQLDE